MTYNLYIQLPNPKKTPLVGKLLIDKTGSATLWNDRDEIVAAMERVSLSWANSEGIKLSGFEHIGFEKNAAKKYRYQEWFLAYRK